jgi:hypothetical protein
VTSAANSMSRNTQELEYDADNQKDDADRGHDLKTCDDAKDEKNNPKNDHVCLVSGGSVADAALRPVDGEPARGPATRLSAQSLVAAPRHRTGPRVSAGIWDRGGKVPNQ